MSDVYVFVADQLEILVFDSAHGPFVTNLMGRKYSLVLI
jgi:hypothetical protein